MNKIRENLYLGSWRSATPEELEKQGITAVVNVAFDVPPKDYHPDKFRVVFFNLGDYQNNKPYMKDLAVQTLKAMLYSGEKVLVHCVVGASRSVYVVVRALAEIEGKTYQEMFDEVKKLRLQALYGPLFHNP